MDAAERKVFLQTTSTVSPSRHRWSSSIGTPSRVTSCAAWSCSPIVSERSPSRPRAATGRFDPCPRDFELADLTVDPPDAGGHLPRTSVQVVFDALDPHAQAGFWAAALGYAVEDTTELIRGVLEAGFASEDDVFEADGQMWWNDLVGARPADATGPRLLFQRTDAVKAGKNRMHLDLNVGPDRRDAEVQRLETLGATVLYEVAEPAGHHVTMADPEGNELCVQ